MRTDRMIKTAHAGLLSITLLATAPFLAAQVGSFESGSDGSDGPLFIKGTLEPLEDTQIVYDAARQEIVAYGGQNAVTNADISTTYVFDGTSWRIGAEDSGPGLRTDHAMAYDAARQQVVLFGGNRNNDTWLWDGMAWTKASPPTVPPPGYRQSMTYDAARGEILMVLWDGNFGADIQTWTWNGIDWSRESPATTFTHRINLDLHYDPALGKAVLVAAASSTVFYTYTWNGSDWTLVDEDSVYLDTRNRGVLGYDGNAGGVVYLSNSENSPSLVFDGSQWNPLPDVPEAFTEYQAENIIYYPPLSALLTPNGIARDTEGAVTDRGITWAWKSDGSVERLTSGTQLFDMRDRPDGVWQFTTIEIGPNVTVQFIPNAANTPVHWLASGDVTIKGTLDVSGRSREIYSDFEGWFRFGGTPGPGGYPGGSAYRGWGWDIVAQGGGPADSSEFGNLHSPVLYPLSGGSGRGGNFFAGGGGGGAIQISSSGKIVLDGAIYAESAKNTDINVDYQGAAGAVLLRANHISGNGLIDAANGNRQLINGRVRLEAWELDEGITTLGKRSLGFPLLPTDTLANRPSLVIESINGVNPTYPLISEETLVESDVLFNSSGPVPVVVRATNIPDGNEVIVVVTGLNDLLLESAPVPLSGGQAIVEIELPKGLGSMEARVSYPYEN